MAFTEEERLKRTVEQNRLLDKARAGDRRALDQLMEMHRFVLLNFLRSKVRNIQDAEDLMQQTLIVAHIGLSSYKGAGTFSAWLLGIASILCRNYYRRILPKRANETSLDVPPILIAVEMQQSNECTQPYDSVATALFVAALLSAAATACTETERRVLNLAFTGATREETSRILVINEATVRSHFRRGRQKLLAHLVEHDPEMFGGKEGIEEAMQRLLEDTEPETRLDSAEIDALAQPAGRVKDFRSAVAKLARYLRWPVAILILHLGGVR